MYAKIWSMTVVGIQGLPIEVEIDLCSKSPEIIMVGLPGTAVREAKVRVRTAITNMGFIFPYFRILINFAPADIKKQGPQYDLPIAIGLLAASKQVPEKYLEKTAIAGELALDGTVRPVKGIISMVQAAHKKKLHYFICPQENAEEAAALELLKIYPVKTLKQAVAFFTKEQVESNFFISNRKKTPKIHKADYAEVCGQEFAKRAMLIAAAGRHHCLMIGSPGAGKSMLASRLPSILPSLTKNESVETTQIYSVAGLLSLHQGLMEIPPFRAPHHTISGVGLAGGGSNPRPGEISMAHNGVLFLDELPEFQRKTLEVLRQPLEKGNILISRAKESVYYPSCFILIAAMNPCPCGFYGDTNGKCQCPVFAIERYRRRISGPLLDRFDLHLEVPRVKYQELISKKRALDSATIKESVLQARDIQKQRFKNHALPYNGHMPVSQIQKYCQLDTEGQKLLEQAMNELGFSARAYQKILRIGRTIADLDNSHTICSFHIAEALQYRSLDKRILPQLSF